LVIEPAQGRKRKLFLIVSLIANIGMLAFFKYFNFAEHEILRLGHSIGMRFNLPFLAVILPIGLSFHTFQSMSYTLEVYRGNYRAERHLGIYALYVLFYPQMVAGPIERPQHLLHQFHTPVIFNSGHIIEGLELMIWGLFKKAVIADNLALIVDPVFENPTIYSGWPTILAVYAFAIQIYCDFSGYTDIARGAARVLGYNLMLNFDMPYRAKSISEFWRRWHISLSTWFKDYLYIPLGGNRKSTNRNYLNLLIVFLVSGLWHGASWAFIVWGALHGLYLIVGQTTCAFRQKLWRMSGLAGHLKLRAFIATLITFHFIWIAWVFFRSGTLHKAGQMFSGMLFHGGATHVFSITLDSFHCTGLIISIIVLAGMHEIQRQVGYRNITTNIPRLLRLALFFGGVCWILLWGQFTSHDFIYFQF
jgi:D-alanyl-lipoteichoic acid acyltransferase DltB (MBOAT superfamily)